MYFRAVVILVFLILVTSIYKDYCYKKTFNREIITGYLGLKLQKTYQIVIISFVNLAPGFLQSDVESGRHDLNSRFFKSYVGIKASMIKLVNFDRYSFFSQFALSLLIIGVAFI